MPTPANRRLVLSILFCAGFMSAASAAVETPADRNLPGNQDPEVLRQVVYSFKETFAYAFRPDSTYYGTVDQFRSLYPDSYWADKIKNLTNEDGSLAWLFSRDMMALVVMYDQTGDPWYLEWLGKCVDATLAARDDLHETKDWSGHIRPAWGSSKYGERKRRIYLVHSGLILEPILEWALRAGRLPTWTQADEARRRTVIDRCRETLLWHDSQLDPKPPEGEAVYSCRSEEEDRSLLWQPFNRQNMLARDFYLLYQLTEDESFKERSRKLYTFFKNRIELTPSGAYIWEYEPIKFAGKVRVLACEDVSHASYTMDAVLPACRSGFVFDHEDMVRFARTFTHYVHMGGGVFQASTGCTAAFNARCLDRLYAWLRLAEADPSIYSLLHRFLLHNVLTPPAEAIAFLVAYRPKTEAPR